MYYIIHIHISYIHTYNIYSMYCIMYNIKYIYIYMYYINIYIFIISIHIYIYIYIYIYICKVVKLGKTGVD